ncbi:hypothetical protein KVV02_007952 [Mortierella alpina]|uniref:PH domain-containing protein n=1 Tax=Mortierella alpina TaxID=64518 RepID=A0A9P8A5L5_MORAP|nr:hypothetical protein KVV02_007952 [Mortierella alpina]
MQLHGYPSTTQHTHLISEQTPRSTPIPGPLPVQSHLHTIQRHPSQSYSHSKHQDSIDPPVGSRHHPSSYGAASPRTIARQPVPDTDIGDRGAGAGETMPIPTHFNSRNNSQPDIRPRLNHYHDSSSPVYLHTSSRSHNGSASNLRYASSASPSSHHFHPSHPDNDVSSKHSMTTDDDNSSSASFRQRPRQLSKASAVPSPLGGGASSYPGAKGHHHNNMSISSSAALSTFSFLSSSEKNNSVAATETNGKTPSQLRVRHLDQDSSYAGYLTKFSSRTFFSRKQWKRRYFILHQQMLHCFKSSDPQHPLLETITLSADTIICVTDIFAGKRYCLQISCPGEKNWYVLADTASEMSGWLRELKGIVQRVRSVHPDQRPETLYSESSEISEMSSTSLAVRVPQVPTIPSQYEYVSGQQRHAPSANASSPSSYSSVLPSRHIQPSSYQSQQQHLQHLSPYQPQVTSLNPPPRSITPKPTTPTPGAMPQRTQDQAQGYVYGAGSPSPQDQPETRRRRNSSLSAGQAAPDYASFGSVMERAEVMAAAQQNTGSSSWSVPTKSDRPGSSFSNYATIPRSKRESTMSSMSGTSSVLTNHRVSVVAELPEGNVTLPQRNAQRLTGSFSRSMSPVSSRPMSPNLGRTSPRSSLVISPPPRSIHRPASVSIRHSTQILPPPQIMTAGLSSYSSTATSPLSTHPPVSGLPATPDEKGLSGHGPLSRITSIRHQRDPGLNRQSMISVGSAKVYSQGAPTGSLQERVQRSSSKMSILRSPLAPNPCGPSSKNGGVEAASASNRPLSPVPSLAAAPTQPLPEPPRTGSISPNAASSASSAQVTVTPRHQEQGLPIPTRSTARPRSQSQEDVQLSSKLGDMHLAQKAMTPSPKLNAAPTPTPTSTSTSIANLTLASTSRPSAETNSSLTSDSSQKFMSLPIQNLYTLPAPPTRQTPAQPRPLNQRSSGSSSALRPISTVLSTVPSLGGGIARRPSASNSSKPHVPSRDSMLSASARLSSLISLPPEPTTAVPPPPPGAAVPHCTLPAPPTAALPMKPLDVDEEDSIGGVRTAAQGSGQVGFDVILEEEEEDEDEEEDEEEFGPSLQFEELEAVKDSTETDAEQDSVATTPTTPRRPEYYATKESKVVEYIFPSETFSA